MPGIGDPNFNRAVIALCAHDEQGALGIDIGSEIPDLGLRELLASFELDGSKVEDVPVLCGGPVEPQRGFVLHTLDWGGQGMLQVDNRWGLSGSLDVLKAIAAGKGPARYIVALGYAGWGAGQLESEMTRHGWFIAKPSEGIVFDTPTAGRWTRAFAESGVDSTLLAHQAGHA